MNNKERILIIDDDMFNSVLLSTCLEENGYIVETAENGQEGLDKLNAQSIDLVLLDLLMPEMNGFEVLDKIKSIEKIPHIPVIMTTGEVDLDDIIRCIGMGAVDYLIKPFEPAVLLSRVKNSILASKYLNIGNKLSPAKILAVDDDTTYRMMLTINLEENGHIVTEAENGKVAGELIKSENFDLVFLDLLMPEMDGFELLEILKSKGKLEKLPVIVISAENDMDSIVRCIEMGAVDYLTKPYESEILNARLNIAVNAKRGCS
jgi:CheY-like chemotaxis protein